MKSGDRKFIKLSEIPEEGRDFLWNSKTGEINAVLEDLIQKQDFEAQFSIRPMNSKDFELVGLITTKAPEFCSRCGDDILFPVKASFHEILIPPQPMDRTGKYARVNHISESIEDGPTSTEYGANQIFDMGEYLHEVIGLAVPLNPIPAPDASGRCSECAEAFADQPFSYDESLEDQPLESAKKPNPFEVLKNLKLN